MLHEAIKAFSFVFITFQDMSSTEAYYTLILKLEERS